MPKQYKYYIQNPNEMQIRSAMKGFEHSPRNLRKSELRNAALIAGAVSVAIALIGYYFFA